MIYSWKRLHHSAEYHILIRTHFRELYRAAVFALSCSVVLGVPYFATPTDVAVIQMLFWMRHALDPSLHVKPRWIALVHYRPGNHDAHNHSSNNANTAGQTSKCQLFT